MWLGCGRGRWFGPKQCERQLDLTRKRYFCVPLHEHRGFLQEQHETPKEIMRWGYYPPDRLSIFENLNFAGGSASLPLSEFHLVAVYHSRPCPWNKTKAWPSTKALKFSWEIKDISRHCNRIWRVYFLDRTQSPELSPSSKLIFQSRFELISKDRRL